MSKENNIAISYCEIRLFCLMDNYYYFLVHIQYSVRVATLKRFLMGWLMKGRLLYVEEGPDVVVDGGQAPLLDD